MGINVPIIYLVQIRHFIITIIYPLTIVFGAVVSLRVVKDLFDSVYAIMAIPTMISAVSLAPKVKTATNDYIKRMKNNKTF